MTFSLLGSFVLQLKTLLLLLGETLCWAKVTNFSFSDENSRDEQFRPTKFSPDEVSPDKVTTRLDLGYNSLHDLLDDGG